MELDSDSGNIDPSKFDLPALSPNEEWDLMQTFDPFLGEDLSLMQPILADSSQLATTNTQHPGSSDFRLNGLEPVSSPDQSMQFAAPETYSDFQTAILDMDVWNPLPMSTENVASALPITVARSALTYCPLEVTRVAQIAPNQALAYVPPQNLAPVSNYLSMTMLSDDTTQSFDLAGCVVSQNQQNSLRDPAYVSNAAFRRRGIGNEVTNVVEPLKATAKSSGKRKRSFTQQTKEGVPVSSLSCFTLPWAQETNKRGKWTEDRKKNKKKVSAAGGACFRCRLMKKPCSGNRPCKNCLQALERSKIPTRSFGWLCTVRFRLSDVLEPRSWNSQLPMYEHKHKSLDDLFQYLVSATSPRLIELFEIVALERGGASSNEDGLYAIAIREPARLTDQIDRFFYISIMTASRLYSLESSLVEISARSLIQDLVAGTLMLYEVFDELLDRALDLKEAECSHLRKIYFELIMRLQVHLKLLIGVLRRGRMLSDLSAKMSHASDAIAAYLELTPNYHQRKSPFRDLIDTLSGMESDSLLTMRPGAAHFSVEGIDAKVAESDVRFVLSGLRCDSNGIYELSTSSGTLRMDKAAMESIFLAHYLSFAFSFDEVLLDVAVVELGRVYHCLTVLGDAQSVARCNDLVWDQRILLHYRLGPQHEDDSITEMVLVVKDDYGSESSMTLFRGPRHLHPDDRPCGSPDECCICHLKYQRDLELSTQVSDHEP
ncbi:hypothetical protein AYO22_02241 [Fonsecaea multimorphosa]|nr:hypothetical protein AYO22_02241 [Fonsecaea multimorphosa]